MTKKKSPWPLRLMLFLLRLFNSFFLGMVWLGQKLAASLVWLGQKAAVILSRRYKNPVRKKTVTLEEEDEEKQESRKEPKKVSPKGAVYEELAMEKTVAGAYPDFAKALRTRSLIALVFGKRGSGKSTLGFRLMENIHAQTERPCFVLGVRQSLIPDWIDEIEDIEEVENGGVVLVDEGALTFGSRESMQKKNISLGKLLAIARHKDLTLLFITQNTGMIDKSVLNLADVIMAKEGSLLQQQMERAVLRPFVQKADAAIKKFEKPQRISKVYIFSDDFEGVCSVALPSFWSQGISKSQSG